MWSLKKASYLIPCDVINLSPQFFPPFKILSPAFLKKEIIVASHVIWKTILTIFNCTFQWHLVHTHCCASLTIIHHLPKLNLYVPIPTPPSTSVLSDSVDLTVTRYLVICRIKQYLSAPDTYWNAFLRLMHVPQIASPSMLYSRLSPAVYFIHSSVHMSHTPSSASMFFLYVICLCFLALLSSNSALSSPAWTALCQSVCVCVLVGCHFWLIVIVSVSPIFLSTVSPLD